MYDYLIFDTVNFAYKCLSDDERNFLSKAETVVIGKRRVYKNLMNTMLTTIEFLRKKFLNPNGVAMFLFDNYTSREELKSLLVPAQTHQTRKELNPFYKSTRKMASFEFYATLDLLHYYLKLKDSSYQSARIAHLEADDLLPTAINVLGEGKEDKNFLLISNDSDWCKALACNVNVLSDLYGEPFTTDDFVAKKGFYPSEESIKLEKLLYGDKVDNVKAVFTELSPSEKKYVLQRWDNTVDFLYEAQTDDTLGKYVVFFKDKEKDIRLAYKMLSTIPVSESHFKVVHIKGRSAKRLTDVIDNVFLTPESSVKVGSTSFEFGNLRVPRKIPTEGHYHTSYMENWKNYIDKEEVK